MNEAGFPEQLVVAADQYARTAVADNSILRLVAKMGFVAGHVSRDPEVADLHKELTELDHTDEELGYVRGVHDKQIAKLEGEIAEYREVLEEVALPPYGDSNLASLLTTLKVRARAVLDKWKVK